MFKIEDLMKVLVLEAALYVKIISGIVILSGGCAEDIEEEEEGCNDDEGPIKMFHFILPIRASKVS